METVCNFLNLQVVLILILPLPSPWRELSNH